MSRAKGVDYNSKNKIKKLQAEGYNVEEIAAFVRVEVDCVQKWMDHFEPKAKAKSKAKPKKDEPEEE